MLTLRSSHLFTGHCLDTSRVTWLMIAGSSPCTNHCHYWMDCILKAAWCRSMRAASGYVHTDTSTSLGTCALVPVNTSLLVFQRWPFTLKQVLYEYELPVNFTRTSSFLSGHVFIQPIRCKQHKISIKIIYTSHDAHFTLQIMSLIIVH